MTDYFQGAIVRITATFSANVDTDTYFELGDLLTRYGTPADDLTIIIDESNPKKCYVDIDTFDLSGIYDYHFYSRGVSKAAIKGSFKVV